MPKSKKDDVLSAIESLAIATGAGFDKIDKRLNDMDERLERIEQRILNNHERRLEALEAKLSSR